MKRCFTVLVSIFLAAFCVFLAEAIDVDGYNNSGEWNESAYYRMFSSAEQSGCSAEYADFQVQMSDNCTVCLLIQVIDPSFSQAKSGARVSVGGRGYTLTVNGAANYPNVKYSSHCNNPVADNGYVIEAEIVLPEPITDNIPVSVTVIDGGGSPSKKTTAEISGAGYENIDTEATDKPLKTTVPKTAKSALVKTTKPKTTKYKTTKSTTRKSSNSNNKSNKSGRSSRKIFGRDSKYGDNDDYNFIGEETATVGDASSTEQVIEFDLSEDTIENAGRNKIIAGILLFLIFTAGAVIMIVPRVHKKSGGDISGGHDEENK